MGSSYSEPQQLEIQITHYHDKLSDDYQKLRRNRIIKGFINIIFTVLIVILVCVSGLHFYLIRNYKVKDIATVASKYEFPVIFGFLSIWFFLIFLLNYKELRIHKSIEIVRYKMEKSIEKYEKTVDLDAIRKALKASGKDTSGLLTFSISTSDYGVRTKFTQNNSILTRIIQSIVGDGPDYTYAVICPNCKNHNGFIDKSELSTFKYKCPKCKCKVSTTEVISTENDDSKKKLIVPDINEDIF